MFRKKIRKDEVLLFCFDEESIFGRSIHMLFVFFPIKVYWLDKNYTVVDSVFAKPFRLWYAPKHKSKYILECHEFIDFQIGEKLKFKK